jgi:hypothetical protein
MMGYVPRGARSSVDYNRRGVDSAEKQQLFLIQMRYASA